MTTAVLSLGSNKGESTRLLTEAVAGFGSSVQAVSSVYRTPPWGPVAQDDFANIAVIVRDSEAEPGAWWERAQRLEQAAHRERLVRWGPRTLDVDVIAVWRPVAAGGPDVEPVLSEDPHLILPHPRAHERGFVLVPWAEIDPDAVLPGYGPVAELLKTVDLTGIERVGPLVG